MNCSVLGCKKEVSYKADRLCQMHYFRRMRNGHFDLKETKLSKNGGKIFREDGYVLVKAPNHPLSGKKGFVFEHRKVVFSKFGWDLPPCEFCGRESDWNSRATHIDHIDENKSNNKPENLRVLCNPCNVARSRTEPHKWEHCTAITIGCKTMTATEWARQDDVKVAGSTIIRRLKLGASPSEAVYGEKKTHNGGKQKKRPPPPPKYTRKNAINLTIAGVIKTSAEWSRHPDCRVSDGTIRNRVKSGMDHHSCVFEPPRSGRRFPPLEAVA